MAKFTDDLGTEWAFEINVAATRRMREGGHDFFALAADECKLLNQLATDDLALIEILWAILKTHDNAKDMTQEEFESRISGPRFRTAWEAFLEAYVNFSRAKETAQQGARLLTEARVATHVAKKAEDTMEQLVKIGKEKADALFDQEMTPEKVKAVLDSEASSILKQWRERSTSSPALSA